MLFETREQEEERRANHVIHNIHIKSVREKKPKRSVLFPSFLSKVYSRSSNFYHKRECPTNFIFFFKDPIKDQNNHCLWGFHFPLVSVFLIDPFNSDVIRGKALKYVRFCPNKFSQIANIE